MTLRATETERAALSRIGDALCGLDGMRLSQDGSTTTQAVLAELRRAERRGVAKNRKAVRRRMPNRRGCPVHPKASIKITRSARSVKYTCAACGKPMRR